MRYRPLLAIVVLGCAAEERVPADPAIAVPRSGAVPAFEVDLWPGEGIPVVEAVRADLPLRKAPDPAAAIVGTLTTRAGERIQYDSTRFQTIRSGMVRTIGDATVRGHGLGNVRHLSRDQYYSSAFRDTTIPLGPSATIEFLQHRAEGSCFVRIGNEVVDARRCPVLDTARFSVTGQPLTLWWIRALGSTASGWLLISDTTATVVRRTF